MPLWQCKYMKIPYMNIEHSTQHASSQKRSLSSSETQLSQRPSLKERTKSNPPVLLDCNKTLNKKCLCIFCCTCQRKHYGKLVKIMHCHNCPTYTINNHWWHHETQVCNTDRTKLDESERWVSVCCVSSAPLLLSLWKDSLGTLRCGTMTSLPVSFWVYWSFKCALGKLLYFVQESFLWHHSWRALCISQPTDLDIITSEREITAGSNCNLLHICFFRTVCGRRARPASTQAPLLHFRMLVFSLAVTLYSIGLRTFEVGSSHVQQVGLSLRNGVEIG